MPWFKLNEILIKICMNKCTFIFEVEVLTYMRSYFKHYNSNLGNIILEEEVLEANLIIN